MKEIYDNAGNVRFGDSIITTNQTGKNHHSAEMAWSNSLCRAADCFSAGLAHGLHVLL